MDDKEPDAMLACYSPGWHYGGGALRTIGVVNNEAREDFRQLLRDARMSQSEFRSIVRRLCGRAVAATTTSRWASRQRTAPPCALALLVLIGRLTPEELKRLL